MTVSQANDLANIAGLIGIFYGAFAGAVTVAIFAWWHA